MHEATESPAAEHAAGSSQRTPWQLLVLLCVAQFMVILDVSVVNVALPSIRSGLGFAAADLPWVATAYVLMTGGLLLLGGRLADLLGRRVVFLTGLVVFTGASLASGLAQTPAALIAARASQGLGAALLSPAALSIITSTYTGAQRTTALSTWGAIGGAGAAAGVLLGGILTTSLGWRWVFFINVPVGVLAAFIAPRIVPRAGTRMGSLRDLDLPGTVTVVSGLVVLVYALQGAASHGWDSARTLGLLALAAAMLAAFVAVERRASRPLIPTQTWRVRSLISSTTVMLGVTGILVGTSFINSLFFQNVLRASALETGLAFLPGVLVVGIAAHLGSRLLPRIGARGVIVTALMLIACADLLLSGAPSDASYVTDVLPAFIVLGLGVGLAFVTISVTAMAEIDGEHAGLASGLMTTAHELGGAFGVAIFSAVSLGATAATGAGFAAGYRDGALTGAGIALALALLAVIAVPNLRPSAAQRVALH
jgi:EmrB/QacA subfamily drug resistance transporter